MKNLVLLILFSVSVLTSFSQSLSNIRIKTTAVKGDTLLLDSLSLVPNSVFISDSNGKLISDTLYSIDYAKGILIIKNQYKQFFPDKIKSSYRVFPISFLNPYFHKDISKLNSINGNASATYKISYSQDQKSTFFDKDELNKRGSISRGITFGNNQDVIVNSNLNLQLSGKISENLEILAVITDNNIPIQPDGNSQQIQEFDKVFVQIYNKKTKIIVGDYELVKPVGYYMNLLKKVQGGYVNTNFDLNKEKDYKFKTTFSGAIAKGKYNKMNFTGVEGNQGPYKLTGAENETYIIILAGTEKIYIDGKLLKRGQDNDYIIDYNTGEVTFTPNQPITKDKRVMLEFQYSDKNYARFLVFNSNEFQSKKSRFWVNLFNEQDSKNQPIDQSLTDLQKRILAGVGDSLNNAIVPKVDSVAFKNDLVLYKRIDTVVNSIFYDSIYVYSTNADSAHYRLGFSYVGANHGNYAQVLNSANGRVYKWIAPVTGVKQGNYEPVVLLTTPKQKQMVSAGGEIQITQSTKVIFEFSATNNNLNTFSTKDKADDSGYAFKTDIKQDFLNKDTLNTKLFAVVGYQIITREFNPVEHFRSIEFNRDWNLVGNAKQQNEQKISAGINFFNRTLGSAQYESEWMLLGNGFTGLKNSANANLKYKSFNLIVKGSLLNSEDTINRTQFMRHSVTLSRQFKYFIAGIKEEQEDNKWEVQKTDSLGKNSFFYNQYEAFVNTRDTSKLNIFANYKMREDFLPVFNKLHYAMKAQDFNLGAALTKNPNNALKTTFTYRELSVGDTMLARHNAENTITGRIEHNLNLAKGAVYTSTFYELGSGIELKKEYLFIEVAQGQGVYIYRGDDNGNGVKDLNEFENANFQDQANYIRVFTPTNQYIKTFTNQFSQTINLRPDRVWADKSGIRKLLAIFSNQLAYRVDRKETRDDFLKTANPFYHTGDTDSSLVSMGASIRNTFSFNRTHPVFGIDYVYQDNRNKILLVNGFDSRNGALNGFRIRWNINKYITFLNNTDLGDKIYNSEFFSSRNYKINYITNEATVSLQPGMFARISILYKYNDKQNIRNTEKSQMHNIGVEFKYNAVTKGTLTVNVNYIKVSYKTGENIISTNTPVAYEMLEGLMPGDNATWGVQFQKNLTNVLQMSLNYTGRISEGSKMVHVGGVQMRASF